MRGDSDESTNLETGVVDMGEAQVWHFQRGVGGFLLLWAR